ncbi:hypothetical protein BaRGS_00040078 [Batillaria attramentaria]|uniref:Uncharacterized protein n=1 Tax=Batillaria attramentaria TaxID=370345 RepID=A0ABD0J1I5_9CAEN
MDVASVCGLPVAASPCLPFFGRDRWSRHLKCSTTRHVDFLPAGTRPLFLPSPLTFTWQRPHQSAVLEMKAIIFCFLGRSGEGGVF